MIIQSVRVFTGGYGKTQQMANRDNLLGGRIIQGNSLLPYFDEFAFCSPILQSRHTPGGDCASKPESLDEVEGKMG